MRLQIKDHIIEGTSTQQLLSAAEDYIVSNGLFLNYMVVDGKEVFQEFQEYMDAYSKEQSKIEIHTLTTEEFAEAYKDELIKQIKKLEQETLELSLSFYSIERNVDGISKLVKLLESSYQLKQDAEQLQILDPMKLNASEEHLNQYNAIVVLFTEAIEEKDSIYIADLLYFELLKWIEKFFYQTKET